MAKKIANISERNSHAKSGISSMFQNPQNNIENTLSTNNEEEKEKLKTKMFSISLPHSYHEKLKYEIAKQEGKTVKELIIFALENTYNLK